MEEGYVERGSALSDTEIAALDRVLPRLVDAFEPSARQRIVAGLTYQGRDPTPGYGFLARRLRSCSRPPNAPAEAGMRRTLKERVVTFADVERLMATVGRSAGASDVEDALDRLQVRLAPETGDGQADAEILELCLNTLSQSPDPVPGEASGLGFGDFGDPFDAPPADPLDAEEPDLAHDGYGRPTRPSQRVGDLWERALRAEIDAAGPTPLSEMTGTMQVAIVTGYRGDPKALATALGATMAGSTQPSVLSTVLVDEEGLLKSKAHNTPAKLDALVRSLLDDGNLVVFSAAAPTPPPFVAASAVRRVDLSSCAGVLARVLDGLADAKAGLRLRDGRSLSALVGACAVPIPFSRANALRAWLRGACDAGRVDEAAEATFLRLATASLATPAPVRDGPQSLDAVRGLPEDVSRRLRRLAARMRAPEGGRVGLLLSGEPGVGKTMIAGLLARESGRHFVQASLPEWQASGYLNDFLASMRAAFEEARRNAPSVLFIDEADSIGHRGATGNRSDDYWNMVVNSMLECLHGLGDRGDVAVVAATNHPDLIDPAIRREGRLGETLEIPRPDRRGRADILASLLPEAPRLGLDLHALADRLGPCSSSSIEGLVKEARLLAKEDGSALAPSHVESALAEAARAHAAGRALPALAIGLAAEALVVRLAYGAEGRVAGISAEAGLAGPGRVTVDFAGGRRPEATASDALRALHVALAPAAGRLVVASGGRRPGVDALDCFAHAAAGEALAARAHALALVDSGALSGGAAPDPASREQRGRQVLEKAWPQVVSALRRARPALDAVTAALMADGRVDGDLFERLASGEGRPTLH